MMEIRQSIDDYGKNKCFCLICKLISHYESGAIGQENTNREDPGKESRLEKTYYISPAF